MLFRHNQSKNNLAFAQPVISKFLFENENIQNIKRNSKVVNLKKEEQCNFQIYVYVMLHIICMLRLCRCMLRKSESLCFSNLYPVHAERILDLSKC